jgi:CRP/FNR family cyclic AMP-dependent transcriptional regulator
VTVPPRFQASNAAFNAKTFLSRPAAGKKIQTFEKGQEIFAQGDVANSVFYIQKGKVKVTVLSAQGKEAVVGILPQGQFFGEGCLDGVKLRTSTSHAMEECLLTSLTKDSRWRPSVPSRSFLRSSWHICWRGTAGSKTI